MPPDAAGDETQPKMNGVFSRGVIELLAFCYIIT